MTFLLERDAQGKSRPCMPMSILVGSPEPRTDYRCPGDCATVWPVALESVRELVKHRLVLESQIENPTFVCACLGRVMAEESFEDILALHLSTWGPNCGAPLAVYEGHLMKLLEAHTASITPTPKIGTLKLDRSLICLDVESTGVDSQTDRVIELGIVRLDPDGKRHCWNQRFSPGFPIPPEATAVHGITDSDVAGMPTFESMAEKIHKGLQGRDIAGYSLRLLDLPIIDSEMRRANLKLDLTGVRVIDAAGIFFNKKPRDLSAAVEEFCGRSHSGAHGAAADASASLDVLFGELGRYDDLAAMTIDELAAYSRRGEFESADLAGKTHWDADHKLCYSFGKNKGQRVEDEPGFGQWLLRQRNPGFPASTCEIVAEELKRIGAL